MRKSKKKRTTPLVFPADLTIRNRNHWENKYKRENNRNLGNLDLQRRAFSAYFTCKYPLS